MFPMCGTAANMPETVSTLDGHGRRYRERERHAPACASSETGFFLLFGPFLMLTALIASHNRSASSS
jgi:hypothetical protein